MTIKEIREGMGMTQTQFGEFLGIPMRTIQNWELGIRKCPNYVLMLIEYYCNHEKSLP
jgi:DNA-binding transcriptional regulator YiaG